MIGLGDLPAALSSIPQMDGTTEQPCAESFFYFRDPQCLTDPDSLSDWSEGPTAPLHPPLHSCRTFCVCVV